MKNPKLLALALGAVVVSAACSDDGMAPADGEATIVGRIDAEVQPSPASGASASSAVAATAQAIVVAEIQADGSLARVAEATVESDASFSVAVPAGREHLVVVAMDESDVAVGRTLVHARTEADATIEVAPIDVATTLEGRAYARLRAGGGDESSGEVALLVQASPSASVEVVSQSEVDAAAAGVMMAGATLTSAFEATGASLDASARAELFTEAALDYAAARHAGTAVSVAEAALLDASVDAMVEAGVTLDAIVQATAAAATTMDATLDGATSFRGMLVREAVRLNLVARQRVAAAHSGSAEASLASNVLGVLGTVESSVTAASTAAQIKAALEAGTTASLGTTITAVVTLLVPSTDVLLMAEVEQLALAAAGEARLAVKLADAGTAADAAAVLASYRADVGTSVRAMVDASGNTDVDVDALTSLFVAAYGGVAIH